MSVLITAFLILFPAPRNFPPVQKGDRFEFATIGYTFEVYKTACVVTGTHCDDNDKWTVTLKADTGEVFDLPAGDLLFPSGNWKRINRLTN